MRRLTRRICAATRELGILTGVTGLTMAAGVEWAEAAERTATSSAMPGELHVVFLFGLTLGGLIILATRPQRRARIRGRAVRRHTRR